MNPTDPAMYPAPPGTPAAEDPSLDLVHLTPDPVLGDRDQLLPDELSDDVDTDGIPDADVTPDADDDEGSGK